MKYKYIYIIIVFFSLILVSCEDKRQVNHFTENAKINSKDVFSFPDKVGLFREIKHLAPECKLLLIKEPIIISKLSTDSIDSKNSMFLENFLLQDSSISLHDIDFMNSQNASLKNANWELPHLANMISEKSIDSVRQYLKNYIILKMSLPIFNCKIDKAYLKVVILTNSSLSGSLIKYGKKQGKWIIVDRRQI